MAGADLVFLHGEHTPRCSARVDKRFDGYQTLQYMTRGGVELFYDRRRYELLRPSFWPAYPGPWIRFHPAARYGWWEHRYIAFRGPLAARWQADGLLFDKPQRAPRGRRHVIEFDRMVEQSHRADRWGRLRAINLLERLLLELGEVRAEPTTREPWLERVLARLDSASGADPDYAAVAAECHMGMTTLRRHFRAATGVSLHGYTLQHRIAAARELLAKPEMTIKEIADRLGYRDVFFFSRQFAQHTGVPPAAYRRSSQG